MYHTLEQSAKFVNLLTKQERKPRKKTTDQLFVKTNKKKSK